MEYIKEYMGQLQARRFRVDKVELSAILARAAGQIEQLSHADELNKRAINSLQEDLKDTKEKLEYIQEIVISSEVLAQEIVADAREEAQRILDEAQQQAQQMAQDYRQAVEAETQQVLADTRRFKIDLEQMRDHAAMAQDRLTQAIPQI